MLSVMALPIVMDFELMTLATTDLGNLGKVYGAHGGRMSQGLFLGLRLIMTITPSPFHNFSFVKISFYGQCHKTFYSRNENRGVVS